MPKKAFVWLLCMGTGFLFVNGIGLAQSDTPKLEIGPQFSLLKLNYHFRGTEGSNTVADDFWPGLGARVGWNINDNIALEAAIQKFDTDVERPLTFSTAAQPDVQGLFGVKAGVRRGKLGFFGKVRPGFTKFTPVFDCTEIDFSTCREIRHTGFSLDLGGVVEGYVSRRFMVRWDVGAVYLRHRETTLFFPGEPGISPFQFPSQGFKKFTLMFGLGVGFRFN